jgi:hypothetical protein
MICKQANHAVLTGAYYTRKEINGVFSSDKLRIFYALCYVTILLPALWALYRCRDGHLASCIL